MNLESLRTGGGRKHDGIYTGHTCFLYVAGLEESMSLKDIFALIGLACAAANLCAALWILKK